MNLIRICLLLAVLLPSVGWSAQPVLPLFYLDRGKPGCSAKLYFLETRKTIDWFLLSECSERTENLIFDGASKRTLILEKGKYSVLEWKKGAKPVLLAQAYEPPAEGDLALQKTWIDKQTNRLRVAYLIALPWDESENRQGDNFRKKFPILGKVWVSKHLPKEGIPSVAIVAELGEDKKWTELERAPTTSHADGAEGLNPVSKRIAEKPGVISLRDIQREADLPGQSYDRALKASLDTVKWIKAELPHQEGSEETPVYFPMGKNDGFLSAASFGDSFDLVSPVYYCRENCSIRTKLNFPSSDLQLSFSRSGDHFLISNAYGEVGGVQSMLFRSGSSAPVVTFPKNADAVWLPYRGLIDLL